MNDSFDENAVPVAETVSSKWSGVSFFVGAAIFICSLILAFFVASRIDANNRVNLITRVQTIAYLSNGDDIAGLSGSSADIGTPAYDGLKESLYHLHAINGDTRFLYFMRSNGTKLIFLADSEHTDSKDYSPPGQVYDDTSALELSNYNNQVSFTEGPYTDEWGTWVSGYAPVYGKDGTYTGIIGMDIDAKHWRSEIVFSVVIIIVIGFILGELFFILGLYLRRSYVAVRLSEKMNAYLSQAKKHSDELVASAKIGEWVLTPSSGAVSFNDGMYALTGIDKNIPVTHDVFTEAMTLEGKKVFDTALETAYSKTEREVSCVVKLHTGTHIRLSAMITYVSGTTPVRVSGIAQEISDAF